MNKWKKKIGLTLSYAISLFIILSITMFLTSILVYVLLSIGILNENNIEKVMVLPGLTLGACLIIGTIVSLISSSIVLKNVRKFVEGINKLASGDFNARLDIKHPPEFNLLSENFNRMAEELGGIEVLRTDFINNFSHEFKTPIISIKGFAEILKYDDLTKEERDEYLDIVIDESTRLAALAENVLSLSKIETQSILKEVQSFNISEQLRCCIAILESKFINKNISLDVDIIDLNYIGDKEMFNQVWINLIDNAIKFTDEGGVIKIAINKVEDNIIINISDNGCGITKEALPKIFDKFYQQDISHTTMGNGLGLTIVKKIINLHNGTIKCNSVLNQGTEFKITLPMK